MFLVKLSCLSRKPCRDRGEIIRKLSDRIIILGRISIWILLFDDILLYRSSQIPGIVRTWFIIFWLKQFSLTHKSLFLILINQIIQIFVSINVLLLDYLIIALKIFNSRIVLIKSLRFFNLLRPFCLIHLQEIRFLYFLLLFTLDKIEIFIFYTLWSTQRNHIILFLIT